MMRPLFVLSVALTMLSFGLGVAEGATTLKATLTNAGEPGGVTPTLTTGAPRPASFGTATMVLNDAQTSMTFSAEIFNIDVTGTQTPDTNDNLSNAHIHGSATVTPTTNAGVVWGFHGAPQNDTTPADAVMTPFATGVGGTFTAKWDAPEGNGTTLAAQLNNLLTVHAYVNFHTAQFGGGEIRGMITVVPEPAALLLLALGVAPLVAFRRLQRG